MKKLSLVIIICCFAKLQAQADSIKRFSVGVEFNYPKAIGDNFLSKGYTPNVGFGIEFQYNFGSFFLGLNYRGSSFSNIDRDLIGNFNNATIKSNSFFAGYRHFLRSNKMYFEHRIGSGDNEINHVATTKNYLITGQFYYVGTKVNYINAKALHFCAGVDLLYHSNDVQTVEQYRLFYTIGYQIVPYLSAKLLFGKSLKRKKTNPKNETK